MTLDLFGVKTSKCSLISNKKGVPFGTPFLFVFELVFDCWFHAFFWHGLIE